MTRTITSIAMATALVLSAALVGVFAATPLAVGTADATSTSPHGADANFTAKLDNNAPGTTTANEYYASGLRKDMEAMHTIVLTSEAFQFDSCSSSQVRAFGIDRGNDDPGTETDESLLSAYESISFEKHQITVEFYKEEKLAGGPVGVKSADQIVARGDNCIQNPSEPGWYQISGKINGSTNGDTTTDFSQDTTSHYIYVCDCESRQEAEEKLGPPPSSDGGGESTATPTESGGGESTATPTESSGDESTPTDGGGGESTATPTDGGGGESTPTDGGGGESTATPTDSNRQGQGTTTGTSTSTGNTTGTANATSTGNTTGTANTTSTGNGGGFTGNGSQDSSPSPTDSGGQPGFGLVAALAALALAGLVARRQRD